MTYPIYPRGNEILWKASDQSYARVDHSLRSRVARQMRAPLNPRRPWDVNDHCQVIDQAKEDWENNP